MFFKILEGYINESNSLIIDGLIGILSKHSPFQRRAIQKRFYELRKDSVVEDEPEIKVPDESLELLLDENLFNTITETELDKKIVGVIYLQDNILFHPMSIQGTKISKNISNYSCINENTFLTIFRLYKSFNCIPSISKTNR